MLLRQRHWGAQKPPAQPVIDWGHPLAHGLILCVPCGDLSIRPVDLVKGFGLVPTITMGAAQPSDRSMWGGGVTITDPQVMNFATPDMNGWPTDSCTVVIAKRKLDLTNRVSYTFHPNGAHNTAAQRLSANLPWSDGVTYFGFGGSFGANQISATMTHGDDIYAFVAGRRGSKIYQNGVERASQGTAITRTNSASAAFHVFATDDVVTPGSDLAVHSFVYVWSRELSADEIKWLSIEPYAFIQREPLGRQYVVFSPVPQVIPIGQVTETDTAQPIAKRKSKTVSQALATETAMPITPKKSVPVAQVVEADTGQPVTALRTVPLGQANELDTAQPVAARKSLAVSQVLEGDTAQLVTPNKTHQLGQALESDAAQAIAAAKVREVGTAAETDTAQPVAGGSSQAVGQVVETDTAQALAALKRAEVGQASETDSALPAEPAKSKIVGQVTEGDTAMPVSALKRLLLGQVTELDEAQPISSFASGLVGQVIETDTAHGVARLKSKPIGQVTELDGAQTVAPLKSVMIGQAVETDLVGLLRVLKRKQLGQVVELDLAMPIRVLVPTGAAQLVRLRRELVRFGGRPMVTFRARR